VKAKDIWILKAIADGVYSTDSDGNIVRNNTDPRSPLTRPVKSHKQLKSGQHLWSLSYKGDAKSVTVHRFVALALIPNPNDLPCVNHINGDVSNNSVSNLEWCAYSGTQTHRHVTMLKKASDENITEPKLTSTQVLEMRKKYAFGVAIKFLAVKYGIDHVAAKAAVTGASWRHI